MRTRWTSSVALLTMVLAAGCSPREQEQAADTTEKALKDAGNTASDALETAGNAAAEAVDTTRGLVSNVSVTTAVKGKLAATKGMPVDEIDVTTRDGVVTLNGQVKSAAQKAQAESLTKSTPGVEKVVNNLTVSASAPNPPRGKAQGKAQEKAQKKG